MRSTNKWPTESPGMNQTDAIICNSNPGCLVIAVERIGARHMLRDQLILDMLWCMLRIARCMTVLGVCCECALKLLHVPTNAHVIEHPMPQLCIANYGYAMRLWMRYAGPTIICYECASHARGRTLRSPQPDGKNALWMCDRYCSVNMVRERHGCCDSRYYCAINMLSICYLHIRLPCNQYAMHVIWMCCQRCARVLWPPTICYIYAFYILSMEYSDY